MTALHDNCTADALNGLRLSSQMNSHRSTSNIITKSHQPRQTDLSSHLGSSIQVANEQAYTCQSLLDNATKMAIRISNSPSPDERAHRRMAEQGATETAQLQNRQSLSQPQGLLYISNAQSLTQSIAELPNERRSNTQSQELISIREI